MDRVYPSTVIPVYRGERYLRRLVDEIGELREALARDRLPVASAAPSASARSASASWAARSR